MIFVRWPYFVQHIFNVVYFNPNVRLHLWFVEMSSSSLVKRPAPNLPPKPAPRRLSPDTTPPEGAAVVTGNGSAGGSHDVTSSASSTTDALVQLVAELPDERSVTLYVDAR